MKTPQRIIISRTDKIGDVILTLPMAGLLKKHFPSAFIIFLGNSYTKPVLEACKHIDKIVEWDKISALSINRQIKILKNIQADTIIHVYPNHRIAALAKIAGIKTRIGTSHRWYHHLYTNKCLNLGRKNSELHEAELNIRLLEPILPSDKFPSKEQLHLYFGLNNAAPLPTQFEEYIDHSKFNLILHPKSKGSAREWGLDKYAELVRLLPYDKFNIMVCGTNAEAEEMEYFLKIYASKIKDLTGNLTLREYISLINHADGLIACSTGPLHIAAALGKHALGIYAPMRPIFPQRWGPLGTHASYFVLDKTCNKCRKSNHCECIESIKPQQLVDVLLKIKTGN